MPENQSESGETFYVGQTVWMSNWRTRREPRAVTIAKVAHKYVTVDAPGRQQRFDLSTGHAPDESGWYIETGEQLAVKRAHVDAIARLKAVGFRSTYDFPAALSVEDLNQIAAIAEQATSPDAHSVPHVPTESSGECATCCLPWPCPKVRSTPGIHGGER